MAMEISSAYSSYVSSYTNSADNKKKTTERSTTKETAETSSISAANEAKLSTKAQEYLKNLRGRYGDYDFIIGNSTDDLKALAKSGTKEISVIFSNAELERMAHDEKYAQEKLRGVEGAVKMSEEINRKYGFQSAFGKDGASSAILNKISIVFHEDGTTTFFAELEKSSAKQRERIEKGREEKRARKTEEERKSKKEIGGYSKNNTDTKRTDVWADGMEELLEKISAVDWNTVKSEKMLESGGKFDFSV